ncbi:MAG: nuclear transport factor 2 family protein [Calditrichaeota bacterium]|nr:MAG: nuclear transport factor 2 family protein [Calditrichota bacterium]
MNTKFKETVVEYLDCCNKHDADRMKNILSEDFVFKTYSVNGNGKLAHVSSLEEYISGEKQSYKTWINWSIEPQKWIIGEDSIVLTIKQTSTFKETKKTRTGEDVMIFSFKGDKIKEICQYYEVTSVLNAMAKNTPNSEKK